MSKFSKILILVFLILSVGAGFAVFHFSNAQNSQEDALNTEISNQEFISFENSDSFPDGTVYVCPEASSLQEINPRCPGKIILKLGETIDGLTLTTTNYEGQDYYMVLGFTNGGGGVNLSSTANAGGHYEGYVGLPITFDASSSTDPNADPLQYRWDFDNDETCDTDWLNTSTAEHIWNNDYEGIIKLEVSDGEFFAVATSLVKVISPRSFKQEAILELEELKTNNQKLNKKIDIIIRFINQSLNEDLWIDSSHLVFLEKGKCTNFEKLLDSEELDFVKVGLQCPKSGIMVFYYEKIAISLMKPHQEFEEIINKLTKADFLLAEVAFYDAKNTPIQNPKFQKIIEKQIELAEKELQKANEELQKDRPEKAVSRLAKSWLHSQLAIKLVNF